jgi:stalled ribosome rescue protein Dom34
MTKSKCLGIWMDHASANLMEHTDPMETKRVVAETLSLTDDDKGSKGESQKHNKEQNMLSTYYMKLGDVIKGYEEVILFGPTNAKTELYNKLQASIQFDNIKIEVREADKMTENQQQAFVKAFFSKN